MIPQEERTAYRPRVDSSSLVKEAVWAVGRGVRAFGVRKKDYQDLGQREAHRPGTVHLSSPTTGVCLVSSREIASVRP